MKTIIYNFWCEKDKFDFSLETEAKDDTFLSPPKNKIFCPKCGKEAKVLGEESIRISTPLTSKIKKAHMNEVLSAEAIRMANIAKEQNPIEEVNITSSQKGSFGKTEKVPKKVVESIIEKVKEEEALRE